MMPSAAAESNNSKVMQNSLDENHDKVNFANDKFPSMYRSNGTLKYGMVYRTENSLLRDIATMNKWYAVNKKLLKINVPKLKEHEVHFVDIENLSTQNINETNFFVTIAEKDIIVLNRRINGASEELDTSELDDGQPAFYDGEYGAVYSCQAVFIYKFLAYFDESSENDFPEKGFYFVSFKKLFDRALTPFEIVDLEDIDVMISDSNKFRATKMPETPKSCFPDNKRKKGSKSIVFDTETPVIPIASNENSMTASLKNNKNQDKSRHNIVTPHLPESGETIVAYDKYIARASGPSDILKYLNNLNTKSPRDKKTAKEKEEEREHATKQQEIYLNLKCNVGWHHNDDQDLGDNREIFFTPFSKANSKEGIENLTFFHTRAACYEHFRQNPCLSFETQSEMLLLLKKHGWVEEEQEDKKGKGSYSAYIYKPAKDTIGQLTLGLHQFNNYKSLLQFISRFPFALQDDETFSNTLRLHGWSDNKKKWSVEGKGVDSYNLASLRKEIWLRPTLLFQNITPSLSPDTILGFICVPKSEAEIKEAISPPQSTIKQKKTHVEVDNSGSQLIALAKEYCSTSVEDTKRREKLQKEMVSLMQPANGWHELYCEWSSKWWRHEKATTAPWCQTKDPSLRNESNMIPGIDFFWNFDDIASYIKLHDLERCDNPIELVSDYSSDEWNVNRRIEELAKKPDVFSKKYNFWKMLEYTGWRKITPKGQLKSLVTYNTLIVPKWSDLSNENISSKVLKPTVHYFISEQSVVEYVREAGHIEPSRLGEISEFFANSPNSPFSESSSTFASPKTPITPYRAVAAITNKDGSWQKERHKDGYVYSAVWKHLDTMGYRQIVEKGPLENTAWITPEARMKLEEMFKKPIEQYSKVDIKSLKISEDYFLDKNDILTYVTTRYQIFREPSSEMVRTKKSNTNTATTPCSSSDDDNNVDILTRLLRNKNCNFEDVWIELMKIGWTINNDENSIKYMPPWEKDMTEARTLNRDYYYDKDILIKYLRTARKIEVSESSASNSHKENKSKRSLGEDELSFDSVKKSRNNAILDTVEKLRETPQDPKLAIRYIMKNDGKWDKDHPKTYKFPQIWRNLQEIGWENIKVVGHNESSAYFTDEAIEIVKEATNSDECTKVDIKNITELKENKHYFFTKEAIVEYVDVAFCGADASKYPKENRRQRGTNMNQKASQILVEKKSAPVNEDKSRSKANITPKNSKKRKLQSEESKFSPDSYTSESEEEEYQRLIEEGKMKFKDLWVHLKKDYCWEYCWPTKEVVNYFWVAPWAKSKAGAYKSKGKYDISCLIKNRDYFVDQKSIIEFFLKHGFQEPSDDTGILKKTDKAFGKAYETRRKGDDDDDAEDLDGPYELGNVKIKKFVDQRYHHHDYHDEYDESNEFERLTSTFSTSPNYNQVNSSSSPNLKHLEKSVDSKKRSLKHLEQTQSLKKVKIPIEDFPIEDFPVEHDFKTIAEAIELAKEALTTDYSIDSNVIGREDLFQQFRDSVTAALNDRIGRGIYICGAPGVGKTLLVNKVLNSLKQELNDVEESSSRGWLDNFKYIWGSPSKKSTVSFQIIHMGGTSVLNPNQFYSNLAQKLENDEITGTSKPSELKSRIFQKFSNPVLQGKQSPKAPPPMVILVIDEIDRAPTDLVTELFTAAAAENSILILVGLANQINFPEEGLGLSESAKPNPVLVFESYSVDQLMEIIRRRLYNLAEESAIKYLAQKAAKTGDVRSLIEMTSKCVSAAEDKCHNDGIPLTDKLQTPIINHKLTMQVFRSTQGDLNIKSLIKTSEKGLRVLISLILASGSGSMSRTDMLNSYNTFLSQKSLPEASGDEFKLALEELISNGFLTAENVIGFGGRHARNQGKSQQTKYNLKVTAQNLIKVLKEKNISLGIVDLENMIKQSHNDDDL